MREPHSGIREISVICDHIPVSAFEALRIDVLVIHKAKLRFEQLP